MKDIYISNISYRASRQSIADLFAQFGDIISIKIITNRHTGRLKGYAFVTMEIENANTAISMLDGIEFLGRTINVCEAHKRECDANS